MLVAAPLASYIPLAALGGRARGRRLEHGGEARVRDAAARLARRRGGAARDLPAGGLPRPDRGHPRRLRARRAAVPAPHGAGGRGRAAAADGRGGRGRTQRRRRRPHALRRRRSRPTPTSSSTASPARSSSAPRPRVGAALDRIGEHPKAYVIDFSACRSSIPPPPRRSRASCASARRGGAVYITGATPRSGACCWRTGCGRRRSATNRSWMTPSRPRTRRWRNRLRRNRR